MIFRSDDFENPADSLVYYADLALVTVQELYNRKSSSKTQRKRHLRIAACLLYDVCRYHSLLSPSTTEGYRQLAYLTDVWDIVKLAQRFFPRPTIETIEPLVERWAKGELDEPSGISG